MTREARMYRGVLIMPMGCNSWGGRWEARVSGRFVAADTLAGVKDAIRRVLGVTR